VALQKYGPSLSEFSAFVAKASFLSKTRIGLSIGDKLPENALHITFLHRFRKVLTYRTG